MKILPKFLVIGAQKSGTTTLYEDLRSHPDIFIPDKETSELIALDPNDPASLDRYASLFQPAGERMAGEVSTLYSMSPESGLAQTARALLGTAHILYIVREPVARLISHHNHDYASGLMGPDINVEVKRRPELIINSSYATQIAPWIEAFGKAHVHLIRFEDYVRDRRKGANTIFNQLGLRPWTLPNHSEEFNTASNRFLATGYWQKLSASDVYRRLVRPLLSEQVRRRVMRRVLPKPPGRPSPPNGHTVSEIVDALEPEVVALSEITGTEPWWDMKAVLERFGG